MATKTYYDVYEHFAYPQDSTRLNSVCDGYEVLMRRSDTGAIRVIAFCHFHEDAVTIADALNKCESK